MDVKYVYEDDRLVQIIGTSKNDSVQYSDTTNDIIVDTKGGNDIVWLVSSHSSINTGSGHDTITIGGSGNTINGGKGNDLISNISWLNLNNDVTIYGGTGHDTIDFTCSYASLSGDAGNDYIKLTRRPDSKTQYRKQKNLISGGTGHDTIDCYNDYYLLKGDSGNDIINVFKSNDNTVNGGNGNDIINVSGENHSVYGGLGDDLISLSNDCSNTTIVGATGNDTIVMDNNRTQGSFISYDYGDGNDLIQGFTQNDTLKVIGEKCSIKKLGSDIIVSVKDNDITIEGGADLPFVFIDGDIEQVSGTVRTIDNQVRSAVHATETDEVIDASQRTLAVKIIANDYGDAIFGGTGKDSLYGGKGQDYLVGNAGQDKLYGREGNDTLEGNENDDTLYGGAGDDVLQGGTGRDLLYGGAGNDSLWGGTSSDTFVWADGDGQDTIYDFSNSDMLLITGAFSANYNKKDKEIYFDVDGTDKAITLKDFTATSFNINGYSYKIKNTTLIRK